MSMRNLMRLAGLDLGCALVFAALYSPGLGGLSVADPSPLRAALAVVAGPTVIALAAYGNWHLTRRPSTRLIDTRDTGEIDVSALADRLRELSDEPAVGSLARRLAEQLDDASRHRMSYECLVRDRFGTGPTLSHFVAASDTATTTIIRNAATAANLMGAVDLDEMADVIGDRHVIRRSDVQPKTAATRRDLYERTRRRITEIVDANDELLLAIEEAQVDLVSDDVTDEDTDAAIELVRSRSDELGYYK